MTCAHQDQINRREWFARWARVSILAGLAAMIVRLLGHGHGCDLPASRESMPRLWLLAQCGTPRAGLS